MFTFIVENKYGQRLELTNNPNYTDLVVEGLTPPGAVINTSVVPTSDGSHFNSSRTGERNIVITIKPQSPVETNRINLYKYFKVKQYVKLYYKNNTRDVYIEGYVETFDGSLFEQKQTLQISIICPQPYFKDVEQSIYSFSENNSLFEFPFTIDETGVEFGTINVLTEKSIINEGDEENGVVITLTALSNVVEPTIYNKDTREFFRLNVEMLEGDVITINTNSGSKYVKMKTDGLESNILNKVAKGSAWFKLAAGDNVFTYTCVYGAANLDLRFTVCNAYEGV